MVERILAMPMKRDGKRYEVGDPLNFDKKEIAALEAAGAIMPVPGDVDAQPATTTETEPGAGPDHGSKTPAPFDLKQALIGLINDGVDVATMKMSELPSLIGQDNARGSKRTDVDAALEAIKTEQEAQSQANAGNN